jgi:hypothetical protein
LSAALLLLGSLRRSEKNGVTDPVALRAFINSSSKAQMMKAILLSAIFWVLHDAHANGWNTYVDSMGSNQSDPIGGMLLLLVAGFIAVFGWFLWGRSSIKYIYVPMALGAFVIFLVGIPVRNMLLLPIASLMVGWPIMLITSPIWGRLLNSGLSEGADTPKKKD